MQRVFVVGSAGICNLMIILSVCLVGNLRRMLLCLFVFAGLFVPSLPSVLPSQSYSQQPRTAHAAAQTFKQTHKQTKNIIGDRRETFTKRRKLNKQNSRNVNKNRMRERVSARHNKHTHTHRMRSILERTLS